MLKGLHCFFLFLDGVDDGQDGLFRVLLLLFLLRLGAGAGAGADNLLLLLLLLGVGVGVGGIRVIIRHRHKVRHLLGGCCCRGGGGAAVQGRIVDAAAAPFRAAHNGVRPRCARPSLRRHVWGRISATTTS